MTEYGSILTYKREKGDFTENQEYRIRSLADQRIREEIERVEAEVQRLKQNIKLLEKKVNGE